ncbi:hypothetical protein [Phaeobacter sp. J2-8]|uniref:hypothetical protein n=1 Tax=Phaeobacter sp. J2-8 TaxID=2931394 RepID=UPI001FD5F7CA|nr:hypothetical protein [Phaeobacter sp. J2-8]MCJ7871353.1 hypothetical protein [Phaeobacter sp. J2-8]
MPQVENSFFVAVIKRIPAFRIVAAVQYFNQVEKYFLAVAFIRRGPIPVARTSFQQGH